MPHNDLKYFEILKKEVIKTLQQSYSVGSEIENWKRQEILNLQDDLLEKVNGRISEKWFYTHLKSSTSKLPRIDMLNILCAYSGYKNWQDLKGKFELAPEQVERDKKKRKPLIVIVILLLLSLVFVGVNLLQAEKTYTFCFVDANLKAPIKNSPIWIVLLKKNESPIVTKCDSSGCFSFNTKEDQIQFIVRSPYYKTDTITRIVHNKVRNEEQIQLKTNDYALMIHLFSKSKVTNWKKRRNQLSLMLTNDARIYQVYDDGITGMEMYNKQEFINKLTTPTKSLRSIEIIETIYTGDQISIMRFKQNEQPS